MVVRPDRILNPGIRIVVATSSSGGSGSSGSIVHGNIAINGHGRAAEALASYGPRAGSALVLLLLLLWNLLLL